MASEIIGAGGAVAALVYSGHMVSSTNSGDVVLAWTDKLITSGTMVSGVFTVAVAGKYLVETDQDHRHAHATTTGWCMCEVMHDAVQIGRVLTKGNANAENVTGVSASIVDAAIGDTIFCITNTSNIGANDYIAGHATDRRTNFNISYLGT